MSEVVALRDSPHGLQGPLRPGAVATLQALGVGNSLSPTQAVTQEAALALGLAPTQAFSPGAVAALAEAMAMPVHIGGELGRSG